MEITFKYGPYGNCPVQAEGYINGHPFYFRSRGECWALYVCREQKDGFDPFTRDSWKHAEEYKGKCYQYWVKQGETNPLMTAGWADEDESREFIQKAAKMFLDQISSPQPSPSIEQPNEQNS